MHQVRRVWVRISFFPINYFQSGRTGGSIRLVRKFLRFFCEFCTRSEKVLEVSIRRLYKDSGNTFRKIIKLSIWSLTMGWQLVSLVKTFERFYFMSSVSITKQRNQGTIHAVRSARMFSPFVPQNIGSIAFRTIVVSSTIYLAEFFG